MYQKQLDAIFCKERYGLIEASTKAGKTVGCIVWLYEQAFGGKEGRNYWWVAPIFPQAKIAFRRLKRTLPPGLHRFNESELTITLPNGAVIWFKGADKPDSLFGEDVYAAVGDEASRWKEESWHALRSTLTQTRGPVRLIGNVKGRKNFFYKLARRAQAGAKNMHYAKITAYDAVEAGVLDAAEIADAKALLPDNVFRELYLAEASDDGGNPFGLAAIRAQVAPLSSLPPVALGIDLAKSVDWTVCIALDINGDTCRYERWQGPWRTTTKRIIELVGTKPALVDSTGVGDPILEELQADGRENYEGYKYSAPSKQQLMEGLAVSIQQAEIRYPDGELLPGCVIVDELEEFEYEYTRTGVRYTAPVGLHDDTVNALALARKHWAAHRVDALPFGWLRRDPEFRKEHLPAPLTDEERAAERLADYLRQQNG
jgi:hypothetical protein